MIRRDSTPYAERRTGPVHVPGAIDVTTPEVGFFKVKLGKDTILRAVRLWFGAPLDPVTGEELDRSWRWQAELDDGEPVDFDAVWPKCAGDRISEQEWLRCKGRVAWARQHAPNSAYAERGRRHDPLSSQSPLPF